MSGASVTEYLLPSTREAGVGRERDRGEEEMSGERENEARVCVSLCFFLIKAPGAHGARHNCATVAR